MKKAARTKRDCCQKNAKPQMQKSQCAAMTDAAHWKNEGRTLYNI